MRGTIRIPEIKSSSVQIKIKMILAVLISAAVAAAVPFDLREWNVDSETAIDGSRNATSWSRS